MATYTKDPELCNHIPNSTFAVFQSTPGNEALIVFTNEHLLQFLARGVDAIVLTCPNLKKTRAVLTDKDGNKRWALGVNDRIGHLWTAIEPFLPKPILVSLEEESFHERRPKHKRFCVAVIEDDDPRVIISDLIERAQGGETAYGFLLSKRHHPSYSLRPHAGELMRHLGHVYGRNDETMIYCYSKDTKTISLDETHKEHMKR